MPALADADPTRQLDLLLSPAGQELLNVLSAQPLSSATELRLSKTLRRAHAPELLAAVFGLLELRQRGLTKFERAGSMFFTRAGLEQASAEVVARHRARRFADFERVADLCCGIGGDLLTLAVGRSVLAADLDPVHLAMAGLNARSHGLVCHPSLADVRDVDLAGVQAVFIDPARRMSGRRLRAGASEPPLSWCFGLSLPTAVKAAPGLPLELVPQDWEIEFVADQRELKEALLWSPALRTVSRRATVLPLAEALVAVPGPPVPIAPPGAYVLDPNPAVTRAGLVEDLARSVGAWKIDALVAFLSSNSAMLTPFGRNLRVEASQPWNLKHLRSALRALDVGTIDIRKRGSAVGIDDLQRRLKLDGPRAATVLLTRVENRPWALVCSDA